jgi:peptide chain release factor 3
VAVLEREDGERLALFMDKWDLRALQQRDPGLTLEPMVAAQL